MSATSSTDLAEAGEQQGQRLLGRLVQHQHLGLLAEALGLGLAQHLGHPGVRVLQVRAGVAGGLHHPGDVEDVVLVQPGGQVGVLDRGQGDRRRGLLLGRVQQGVQGDRRALAGLERLAVGAQHHAERDVLGAYVVGQEAGQPGDGEHLVEVVGLPGVRRRR